MNNIVFEATFITHTIRINHIDGNDYHVDVVPMMYQIYTFSKHHAVFALDLLISNVNSNTDHWKRILEYPGVIQLYITASFGVTNNAVERITPMSNKLVAECQNEDTALLVKLSF